MLKTPIIDNSSNSANKIRPYYKDSLNSPISSEQKNIIETENADTFELREANNIPPKNSFQRNDGTKQKNKLRSAIRAIAIVTTRLMTIGGATYVGVPAIDYMVNKNDISRKPEHPLPLKSILYRSENWWPNKISRISDPVYQIKYAGDTKINYDNSFKNNSLLAETKNIDNLDIISTRLAEAAKDYAIHMNTFHKCYTGYKHALLEAGIIKQYDEYPLGDAKNAIPYLHEHPEQYIEIAKTDGENFSPEELQNLPAGCIVVYTKDGANLSGHIAITNGNGWEYSDCAILSGSWLIKHGKDAKAHVFILNPDNWTLDNVTDKLQLKQEI